MGYRPSIKIDGEYIIEFGKFYSYVKHDNLKSIKWLEDHKKIEVPEPPEDQHGFIFYYSWFGPSIDFTAEEFREFWDLYIQDINEYDFDHPHNITYNKPFDSEITWKSYNFPGTFKESVYDTDKPKTIFWG